MVVIDMDMPESCQDCRAYGTSACDKWDKHKTFSDQRTKRHKDCLIVGEIEQELKIGHWIPVSESLPEFHKEVLTCSNGGFIEIQSLEDSYDGYWENQSGDWTDFDEVIAWMPLPEPPHLTDKEKEE